MLVVARGRRQGKTTRAILDSAQTGATIVSPNARLAHHVEIMAKEMGMEIPTPISFNSISRDSLRGSGIRKIIIDDADMILGSMISADILEITISEGFVE